jgi:hypothetical protein
VHAYHYNQKPSVLCASQFISSDVRVCSRARVVMRVSTIGKNCSTANVSRSIRFLSSSSLHSMPGVSVTFVVVFVSVFVFMFVFVIVFVFVVSRVGVGFWLRCVMIYDVVSCRAGSCCDLTL